MPFFINCRFLNPNPPSYLCFSRRVVFFPVNRSFCHRWTPPKLEKERANILQDRGRNQENSHYIIWEAIVTKILLMRINFPGCDKFWNLQDSSLLDTFLRSGVKASFNLLSTYVGHQRYSPNLSLSATPITRRRILQNLWWGLRGKTTYDLGMLITSPEIVQNSSNVDFIRPKLTMLACKKNGASSAKNKWLISGALLDSSRPSILPSCCILTSRLDNISIQRMKRYGERGSPWRRPAFGKIFSVGSPLTRTEYVTDDTHCMIHWTQLLGKPILDRSPSRNFQLTRSYALLIKINFENCVFFLFLTIFIISWARR